MEQEEVSGCADDGKRDEEMAETWSSVRDRLSELVSEDAFERWFKACRLVEIENRIAKIGIPNEIHQVWIESNYMTELQAALNESGHDIDGGDHVNVIGGTLLSDSRK